MMQRYFVSGVRQREQEMSEEKAALKTKADAESYVKKVRERIQSSFGPFPKKTLFPRKAQSAFILIPTDISPGSGSKYCF